MKEYIVETTNMTDTIHAELLKFAKGQVGEYSRLGGKYILATEKKNLAEIKKLPFVLSVEENTNR